MRAEVLRRWQRKYGEYSERLSHGREVLVNGREIKREKLYLRATRNEPGAIGRYFRFVWTHCHPYNEWPDWWAEQCARIDWAQRLYGDVNSPWQHQRRSISPAFAETLSREGLLGQVIVRTPPAETGSYQEDGVIEGAFYVDPVNGNDSNDGILAAEGGSGAWRTWQKLNSEAISGRFTLGDHIYLRDGTYVPTAHAKWTGGNTTNAALKRTLEGYPGEIATLDFEPNNDMGMIDGVENPLSVNSSGNWRFKRFTINSYALGLGTNQTVTEGCEFIGLKRTRAGTMKSEGNGGVLKIGNASNYLLVEGCDFEENEANNRPTNGATAYFIYTGLCTWRYNYIKCMGRASSIHNKRNNNPAAQGDTEISGNMFYKKSSTGTNGQNIFEAAGTPRALFDNNVFASDVSCAALEYTLSGRGGDTGWECQHFKNTFVSLTGRPLTTGVGNNAQRPPAGQDSEWEDNVYASCRWDCRGRARRHNTRSDYCLYRTGGAAIQEFETNQSLARYARSTRYKNASDSYSVTEDPVEWAGTLDPADPSTFALASTSNGYRAASDGSDMGVDPSLLGPVAIGY